jgi:hypothetical protein
LKTPTIRKTHIEKKKFFSALKFLRMKTDARNIAAVLAGINTNLQSKPSGTSEKWNPHVAGLSRNIFRVIPFPAVRR